MKRLIILIFVVFFNCVDDNCTYIQPKDPKCDCDIVTYQVGAVRIIERGRRNVGEMCDKNGLVFGEIYNNADGDDYKVIQYKVYECEFLN